MDTQKQIYEKIKKIPEEYWGKGCFHFPLFRNKLRGSQIKLLTDVITDRNIENLGNLNIIKGALLVVLLQIQDNQSTFTAYHSKLRTLVIEGLEALGLTFSKNIKTGTYSVRQDDRKDVRSFIEDFQKSIGNNDYWKIDVIPKLLEKHFSIENRRTAVESVGIR